MTRKRPTVRWTGVKSRKRQSRYVWRMTPIETAIRNAAVAPKQSRDLLTIAELSALEAITHGRGTMSDFKTLVNANNLAEVLAKDFRIGGQEVRTATEAAEAALLSCARRIEQTGRIGFSGSELADIREMTRQQEREWLANDLLAECGEAVW